MLILSCGASDHLYPCLEEAMVCAHPGDGFGRSCVSALRSGLRVDEREFLRNEHDRAGYRRYRGFCGGVFRFSDPVSERTQTAAVKRIRHLSSL